jgi:hypothetical protein
MSNSEERPWAKGGIGSWTGPLQYRPVVANGPTIPQNSDRAVEGCHASCIMYVVVNVRAVLVSCRTMWPACDVKYWMLARPRPGAISYETKTKEKKQKQEFNQADSLVLHRSEKNGC